MIPPYNPVSKKFTANSVSQQTFDNRKSSGKRKSSEIAAASASSPGFKVINPLDTDDESDEDVEPLDFDKNSLHEDDGGGKTKATLGDGKSG